VPDEPQPSRRRAAAQGSSAASSAAGNPLVGDAGPAFDPAEPAATPIGLRAVEHDWAGDRVKRILKAQGLLTHEFVGVGVEDWLWRESELEAISEPLAAAMNRIPMVRAAAAVSDELTVGAVMFEYSLRSIRERTRVLRALKEAQDAERRPARPQPQPSGPRVFTTGAVADEDIQAEPAQPVDWEVP
jgi:hypothetical protein